MKTCSKCKSLKSVEQFSKNINATDGLQTKCKQCVSEYTKANYAKNPEAKKAKVKERYEKIGQDEWYGSRREWYQEYYQKNKERINKRNAEYARNNREVRRGIKSRYRTQLVKGMSKLDRKKSTIYRKRIKDTSCYYCGEYTIQMHDDHYYPLARGGTDHWFNLVRSCSTCNQKKNARLASHL